MKYLKKRLNLATFKKPTFAIYSISTLPRQKSVLTILQIQVEFSSLLLLTRCLSLANVCYSCLLKLFINHVYSLKFVLHIYYTTFKYSRLLLVFVALVFLTFITAIKPCFFLLLLFLPLKGESDLANNFTTALINCFYKMFQRS